MKKKMLTSMGIALVLVVALAATAFADVSISGTPETVKTGDTVTVTITGTGEGVNGSITATGLEFVECNSELSSPNAFVLLPDYGRTSVNYTYKVTAESGTVSVALSNIDEAVDGEPVSIDAPAAWTATVESTPAPSPSTEPTPSQEPTTTPSGEPTATATATGSASAAPSGSVKPTSAPTTTQDRVPKTGDATMDLWVLAVLAAGCTAVAVIAGKKVLSSR